jgi:probable blue pigment (indigoidine) exporter
MPAGAASLIGLVNPVVGTLLGVLFAAEIFGWVQALGMTLVLGGVLAGQARGARVSARFGAVAARLRNSSPAAATAASTSSA